MGRRIRQSIATIWLLAMFFPCQSSAQDSLALQPQDHLYNFSILPAEKTIARSGTRLYVGMESPWLGPGILIVNLTTEPGTIVTMVPQDERVNKLAAFGNYLLVTSNQSIRVYGTHQPNELNQLATFAGVEGMRFLESWVHGSTVITLVDHPASQSYDLMLINMGDFSNPHLLADLPIDNHPSGVSLVDDLLIFEVDDETYLLDISNPSDPVYFGTVESETPDLSNLLAAGFGTDGVTLYYHIQRNNALDQLLTLQIADPEQPDTIGTAQVARDILPSLPSRLLGNLLLVPTSMGMTDIYRVGEDQNPEFVASLDGLLNEIVDSEDGVYLTNHLEEPIYHVDLDIPADPSLISQVEGRELRPLAHDRARQLLYIHDGEMLRAIRIHEYWGGWLEEIAAVPFDILPRVRFASNHLYHWTNGDTIQVTDLTNPAIPTPMTPWIPRVSLFPGDLLPSSNSERLVKIEASGEMHVYSSFSNPPEHIASLRIVNEPPPLSVALRGDILAVLLPGSELRLYDIVNPFGVQHLSTLIMPYEELNHLDWVDDELLVRSQDFVLKVNVSDQTDPFISGEIGMPYHGTCNAGPGWLAIESRGTTTFFDTEGSTPASHTSIRFNEDGSPFAGTHDFVLTTSGHTISLYQLLRFDSALADGSSLIPSTFSIDRVYPNPFNGTTTVSLTLPENSNSTISVFDLLGREVLRENLGTMAGEVLVPLDVSRFSSGTYLLRLSDGSQSEIRRITYLK